MIIEIMNGINKYLKEVVMVGVILTIATSCYWKDTLYHQYCDVGDGWTRKDTLLFKIPSYSVDSHLDVAIDVRYTDKYP